MTVGIEYIDKKGNKIFIKDIQNYLPKNQSNAQLADDWRIVLAWHTSFRKGKKMKVSSEEIENLALGIMREMIKRDMKFNPSEYKPLAKELYVKTLNRLKKKMFESPDAFFEEEGDSKGGLAPVAPSGIVMGDIIELKDVMTFIKPFRVKDWVYLVGGLVEHGKTKGDIDILIREKEQNPALEFRLYRMFPPEYQKRMQFIYDSEKFGPFTSYIPLFKQRAEVGEELTVHKMEDEEKVHREVKAEGMVFVHQDQTRPITEDDFSMQKPFGHPAGKANQTGQIIPLIPKHSKFVEPFCGSATVFFSMKNTGNVAILNDLNPDVVKAMKICKSISDEGIITLSKKEWVAKGSTFNSLLKANPSGDVDWIYRFIYTTNNSWGKMRKQFSEPNAGSKMNFSKPETMTKIREHMKNCTVTSEDYLACMKKHDSPSTFFYLDPPYYTTKDSRTSSMKLGEIDFDKMIVEFKKLEGKFIMSLGDDRALLKKFKKAGFYIKKIKKIRDLILIKGGKKRNWPLVANFDMKKESIYNEDDYEVAEYDLDEPITIRIENDSLDINSDLSVGSAASGEFFTLSQEDNFDEVIKALQLKEPVVNAYEDLSGEIVPLKFFKQLKGIAGYRKLEVYNIPGMLEVIARIKDFYPAEIDQKYDGMRVQIHKLGKKVKLWSEDGGDLTSRFPSIVKEALTQPDSVRDAELTGWTGGFRTGKHIGRSDVSGYAHKKSAPSDNNYYANVFDVLWFNDQDLHGKPLIERRKLLEKKFTDTGHIRTIEARFVNNAKELIEAVKFFSNVKGSEGAMIKSARSLYPLSGHTSLWIKFKNEVDMDVEVVDIHKVKDSGKTYNYLTTIRSPQGISIPAGRTYNTNIKADIGDIIRVAFVNLNKYTDPKSGKVWYNMWAPRPIELRDDKKTPDISTTAERIVKATKGEVENKPFPTRYKKVLKEYAEHQDQFLTYPEKKKSRFVLQAHIRGRSVHLDDRRQFSDDFAVGMTHFLEKGLSRQPRSFSEAKRLYYDEIHPTVLKHLSDPTQKLLSGRKALVPIEWLDVSGYVEKGEPGATKNEPGFFIIIDKGEYEAGALKPWSHEYFYHGKIMKGKYLDRLLENKKEWDKVGDDVLSWMFFHPTNPPYVITQRAIDKDWMPPQHQSALPLEIEKKIPFNLQFWKAKTPAKRKEIRKSLYDAIKKKEVVFQKSARFTFQRQVVEREKIVVRQGPKKLEYHVSIDVPGESGLRHYRLVQNPLDNEVLTAHWEPLKGKELMTMKGRVPKRSKFNKNSTTAVYEILDVEQPVTILEWNDSFVKVKFKGDKLKGFWTFSREGKSSNLFEMKRQISAPDAVETELEKKSEEVYMMEVHSMDSVQPFSHNPNFLEISGLLFHRGKHKELNYKDDDLKRTILKPRPGNSITYVNWYHNKGETYKVGIFTNLWWDPKAKWECSVNGISGTGALRYRAVVTEPNAINEILDGQVGNVSAELRFEDYIEKGKVFAESIEACGLAITSSPALPAADIDEVCTCDAEGKRVCKTTKHAS